MGSLHPQGAHSSQLEFGNYLLKKRYSEMLLPVSQISACVVQETLTWFVPNARRDLGCIQSREKTGARREELFIILVPTERSKIYFLSNLRLCQPFQTHGKTCSPIVCLDNS